MQVTFHAYNPTTDRMSVRLLLTALALNPGEWRQIKKDTDDSRCDRLARLLEARHPDVECLTGHRSLLARVVAS